MNNKPILDACCGSKMFYFDKHDPRVLFQDIRDVEYTRNDLMPHHIRITKVTPCRLQDITQEECLREGIVYLTDINKFYFERISKEGFYFTSPQNAFFMLINKLNGYGYWYTNPQGYAYEFELIK